MQPNDECFKEVKKDYLKFLNKEKIKGIDISYLLSIGSWVKEWRQLYESVLNISNNGQSSSILEFGTHTIHHPQVHYVGQIKDVTTRLDTLIEKNNIPIENLNFINYLYKGRFIIERPLYS